MMSEQERRWLTGEPGSQGAREANVEWKRSILLRNFWLFCALVILAAKWDWEMLPQP